jgi:hypothetical protein
MEIKKAKFWSKSVQGENIEHVRIEYKDGDSIHVLHQFDKCAVAAPEFYDAFNNLPVYVCKMAGLGEGLKHGIFVSDVQIEKSEDKHGNDTSIYKLICKLKAGYSNANLIVTCQHKYIPEGFAQAIKKLIDESKEYIDGKREQINLFYPNNTEIVVTGDPNPEGHKGPEYELFVTDEPAPETNEIEVEKTDSEADPMTELHEGNFDEGNEDLIENDSDTDDLPDSE